MAPGPISSPRSRPTRSPTRCSSSGNCGWATSRSGLAARCYGARRATSRCRFPLNDASRRPASPLGTKTAPSITTTSLYGELRAPVLSRASTRPLLRGLELQVAARYDANQADIPSTAFLGPRSQYDKAGTVYTAGLRVFPLDALLLRASIATGVSPPNPEQMSEGRTTLPAYQLTDPARGGQLVALNNTVVLLQRGSTALRPERAQTIALGVVYNPDEGPGPRVSLDYTRTRKRGEISNVGAAFVVANEALYPGRIVRAALTPGDIAAGYSAGAITQIDATYMNIGRTNVDALDLHLDEVFRLRRDDTLRLFAAVTWTPRLTRQVAPDRPVVDYVATNDGPLEWRGAGGAVWESGDLSLRLDAQYYGSYVAVEASSLSTRSVANLSSRRVPAQVYLDAEAALRLRLARWRPDVRDVEIRFGIQNVLDHDPPVAPSDFGYSLYGDPRGRRFELSATARF
ncbi:hypothetical protein SGCZBJ_17750 [Caulobacter zeae]|uniref:TonB-dependent receptor-like beta-barrel domain-containing protein n=1 Tax=Caulobacter zeae TaxID=2055137 RepID=A0A2N5D9D0_9CAUL|nr:hypothetical protein SGCZBJ_17750 [Caulobacter zeae]